MRVLMLDNYDSFTYNLVQYLGELGADVQVYRNDALRVAQVAELDPERIVISPGPCTPNEAGISVDLIRELGGRIPVLGVCLGHQAIGQAYGGHIVHAGRVMHGKVSAIRHRGEGVFRELPDGFQAKIKPWITERSRADDWANAREMRTLLEKAREAQAMRIATDPSADLSRLEIVDLIKATGRG